MLFYKKGNPALAQFGIKSKATKVALTGPQMVARAAKVVATKKLRGTLTKKQKAQLVFQGTVAVNTAVSPGNAPSAGAPAPVAATPPVTAAPVQPAPAAPAPAVTPASGPPGSGA